MTPLVPLALALAAAVPTIEGLDPDERVEIRFRSYGCFHHSLHQIDLVRRSDGGVDVSIAPIEELSEAVEHRLRLDERDVRRLDRMLDRYRGPRADQVCTSGTELELVWRTLDGRERRERLEDSTCALGTNAEILTLHDVVRASEPCLTARRASWLVDQGMTVFEGVPLRTGRRPRPFGWLSDLVSDLAAGDRPQPGPLLDHEVVFRVDRAWTPHELPPRLTLRLRRDVHVEPGRRQLVVAGADPAGTLFIERADAMCRAEGLAELFDD